MVELKPRHTVNMPNQMDSTQIHKAMRDRQPVIYEGRRYDRITEFVAWYDGNKKLQLSVVLLSGNYTIRVPASKVALWKEGAPPRTISE